MHFVDICVFRGGSSTIAVLNLCENMISIFQKIRIIKSQRYLFNTKLKLFYAEVYLYLGYGIL